jgi:broad specificity phosphatase PhoE
MIVGKGMLDAACPGDVFAAPRSDYAYQTTKLLASPKGVLYIINNYTGQDGVRYGQGARRGRGHQDRDPVPGALTQRLMLARHGQTADNAEGLILGRRDPPLSELGAAQARALAAEAREAGIASLWTSPLQRAAATAAIVSQATGAPVSVLNALAESDRGDWEGRPVDELRRAEPERFAAFEAASDGFLFPGGESLAEQVARTRRALDQVVAGPQLALVVAHVGTVRAAMLAVGRRPPPEADVAHAQIIELPWPLSGMPGRQPT